MATLATTTPYLTQKELVDFFPEKIYAIPFVLHYEAWKDIDPTLKTILNAPVKIKFDATIRAGLGPLSSKKGIYMFFIEPEFPFIPEANYLVYVGRVYKSNTFYKRFNDYIKSIGNKKKRRNMQLLTNAWPGKTWVYFYELSVPDNQIKAIEKNLFNNIIPPLNNQFSCIRAMNSRSIYN